MEKYRVLGKKGEGTFSEVLKCQNVRDGTFWAAKKMKQLYKSMDEIHQIREIRVLKQLNGHPNIIFLREIIFDKRTGILCLIFELMSMNLYEYIRGRQRLLSNEIVKPENILIKDDMLKLADFGSCRQTLSKQPFTEYISTRWYRAPECLLTDGYYRHEMDIWSAGCVMFEIITLRPLFPGSNELDQISKIHEVVGTPSPSTLDKFQHRNSAVDFNFPSRRGTGIARHLTHCSADTIDLLNHLCTYDPDHRISASQALRHPYFDTIRNQENEHMNEHGMNQWENGARIVKTSEDQYQRSDSSSSKSSINEEISPSEYNNHNTSTIYHTPIIKPDLNRLIYPPAKAQSLIDTRLQGQSIKKSSMQHPNNIKTKNSFSQYNQTQSYYSSLSTIGTKVLPYQTRKHRQTTKNSPKPFLPPVSGASAFSHYPVNNGHAPSIIHKDHNQGKQALGYYPIMSYRSYKK
ncbi:unnamed protein product [Rotaria sp. Silwood1]|nr:unnamed protein product [Rotaria sp. Silwood1]CAF1602558.1 unnamed protein product [Rotaria sp. Silwood1]CAF3718722.1 unnamed protein product [Rotaria sp. Silwood1]CAF4947766.1 unnamed protein product [Rotaria sp. Silwood1]